MGKKIELEKEFIDVETSFLELKNSNASDSEKIDSMNYFIICISEYIEKINIENEKLIRKYKKTVENLLTFFKIGTITNLIVLILGIFNLESISITSLIICFIVLISKSVLSTKKNLNICFNNAIIEQYNTLSKECKKELQKTKEKIKNRKINTKPLNNYEYTLKQTKIIPNSNNAKKNKKVLVKNP